MTGSNSTTSGYYDTTTCDLDEFARLVSRTTDKSEVPNSESVLKNVPIYDSETIAKHLTTPDKRQVIMAEWAHIMHSGAGVLVVKSAQSDLDAIDEATAAYKKIIAFEKTKNGGGADHFAAAGTNDRVWNSLQKLCEASPETFIRYFSSPAIDAVCEAWLGPNYQMTAQVNLVHPGGQSQQAHRDYHLGFQSADVSSEFPVHVHDLSPLLTLQAGIAHGSIPIESGPTKLLPFSQLYKPGYSAWRRVDFRAHFEEKHVQLPLEKGDAVFFNPALFHAAGENWSKNIHRMVNLLQVSSAFGRAMETIDRLAMCRAIYEPLRFSWAANQLSMAQLDAVIASTAEGYSFPTNLDRDPPVGGLAPKTQQVLLKEHVLMSADRTDFLRELDAQLGRKGS